MSSFTNTCCVSPVVATVLILVLSFATTGFTHEVKFGTCPKVEVMEGFDFKKFTGLWYVVEKTNAVSTCLTLNFFEDNGAMKVREAGKPLGISIPFVAEEVSQVGDLRSPSSRDPGRMKVAYPVSIAPYMEKDFWIVDTDYTTFAAIFSCRSLVFAHTQAGIILSREQTLDREKTNELRARFEYFGVNKNKLANVDQTNCRRNSTLVLDSDHDIFGDGGGSDATVVGSKPANDDTEFIITQRPVQDNEIRHGRQRRHWKL